MGSQAPWVPRSSLPGAGQLALGVPGAGQLATRAICRIDLGEHELFSVRPLKVVPRMIHIPKANQLVSLPFLLIWFTLGQQDCLLRYL